MHDAAWDFSKKNNVQFLHMQKTVFECHSFCILILFVIILQACAFHNYIYKYFYFFQGQRIMSAHFND